MVGARTGIRTGLRWGVASLATVLIVSTVAQDAAEARSRRHHHHRAAAARYNPPYAAIVVDANTGKTLSATEADSSRHPASLTKIMTLYLLFEKLDAGKVKLTDEFDVSAHASAQAPSKLGLKPGDSIKVEAAIRAIVTKSANDVAVVIAEALGGSEPAFARQMTAKAHALGMTHTTYRNASGLPDDEQVTTARDQALLGRAILERFPRYYAYFDTKSFSFRGRTIRGHNRLLAVEGVDGIKTGYIRASGFNIVTSMHRGDKRVIAAVFGGRTARWRDARTRDLVERYIKVASNKHTAPPVGEDALVARNEQKKTNGAAPIRTASAGPTPLPPVADVEPGSTDPIKPIAVKTVTVKAAAIHGMTLTPPSPPVTKPTPVTTVATVKADPPAMPPIPPGNRPGVLGVLRTKVASAVDTAPTVTASASTSKPHVLREGGYMIQVGAFDAESEAKDRLEKCKSLARTVLDEADSFTERVSKRNKTLYRARFAGLDKDQAEAACKHLRRGEIPCFTLKN